MLRNAWNALLLLVISSPLSFSSPFKDAQNVFVPSEQPHDDSAHHVVDPRILAALDAHADPVDALVSLRPGLAQELAEPRLLLVLGEPKPEWMTEGDKLRLRRNKKKFMDITDHQDFYAQQIGAQYAGKARESTPVRRSRYFIHKYRFAKVATPAPD